MCELLKVSRSGYYKWLKNKDILNNYELNRKCLGELIENIHKRKPSYGYHRINAIIKRDTGWIVSDNLVHKVCKILKIKSKAKHYKYKSAGEESIKFKNIVNGNWNVSRPFEIIVSDTTTIGFKGKPYDWTFYLDIFNNEIVGYDVRESMHGNGILNHRVSFNNMFNSYKVTRSMSRAGTPTDNPVIESKNGWIKKEMHIDFDKNNYNTVQEFIADIVWDNNYYRPSFALQYKNPVEYRKQQGFK